jgi:hypothetical protein
MMTSFNTGIRNLKHFIITSTNIIAENLKGNNLESKKTRVKKKRLPRSSASMKHTAVIDLELDWIDKIRDQVEFANSQVLTQFNLQLKLARQWVLGITKNSR